MTDIFNEKPKVSVIVPVFNAGNYLETCLESLINQTLQNIELICVDDGSTDNSISILNKYASIDSRIKIIKQKQLFAGVARNNGMEVARGDYYIFLDADDFFELDLLEKAYQKITMFDADVCLFNADRFDNQSQKITNGNFLNLNFIPQEIFNKHSLKEHLFDITSACPWTKMFSARFVKKYKLQFQSLPRANDVFFVLTALYFAERIVFLNEILVHYRVNNNNSLQNNNKKTPTAFLAALDAVFSKIDFKSNYIIQAFANVALGHIAYNLRSLEAVEAYEEFYQLADLIKRKYLEKFFLNNRNYSFFTNKRDMLYLSDKGILNLTKSSQSLKKVDDTAPIVSFIVPFYNSEEFLSECLDSITCQTVSDIEIICIDDASTDNSLYIVENYQKKDSRITVLRNQYNKGAGGARNIGLEKARGKYIWFIDSDDFIDKDSLNRLLPILEVNQLDLLAFEASAFKNVDGKYTSIDEGAISRNWPKNRIISIPNDINMIPDTIEGSSVTYIAKRVFVNRYRFRESVAFEDADFQFKLYTTNSRMMVINYRPYHRRITYNSTTGSNASGMNKKCIHGRLMAAYNLAYYIKENNIHYKYAIQWLNKWAKWSISLYLTDESIKDPKIDKIVLFLQKELKLFTLEELDEYRSNLIPKIIVSLTTIPERINSVHHVIQSLIDQITRADEIHLYLASDDFSQYNNEILPLNLKNLAKINPKFKIIFCDNLKPHKKYYYAMKNNPDAIVVTVDDDIIYDNKLLSDLLSAYLQHPDCIICRRGHTIKMYDEVTIAPYKKWMLTDKIVNKPSLLILPTGVGGVLYPPHSLSKSVFDKNKINQLVPLTDDLWLKWMELKINTRCLLLQDEVNLNYIEGTQDNALWIQNVNESKNDTALKNIIENDTGLNIENEHILNLLFKEYINDFQELGETQAADELRNIKTGYSFRIGRIITWGPRKVRGGVRCLKEHGIKYTAKRVIEHLGIDMGTGDFRR
jgi:glycosyltransferase involved in cell wall biosynthesis